MRGKVEALKADEGLRDCGTTGGAGESGNQWAVISGRGAERSPGGHSLIPPWSHPPLSAEGSRGRSMGCASGTAALGDAACGIQAGNCNNAVPSAMVSQASNFKGNSGKGFRRRDIMTSSAASLFRVGPADWAVLASRLSFGLVVSHP